MLPEAQCGFRPRRSTIDVMYVIRRLQEHGRLGRTPLFVCFINLQKAYDSVDRSLLWVVLARFGVPPRIISIIRQFHDGMRACIRLDGNRTFQRFEVRQGLRKGYVLAPLLLNIFLTTILKHRGEVVQGRPCRGSGSGQH